MFGDEDDDFDADGDADVGDDVEGEGDEGGDPEDQQIYCFCQKLSYGEVRPCFHSIISIHFCLPSYMGDADADGLYR